MSDIYLSITETPTVVTLTNPLISSNVAQSVTVTNVVSVNVVTMPAITVQAAAPAVTTVAGTVSISNFPSTQTVAGTVTANGDYIGVVDTDTSAPPRGIAIGFLDANQSGNFVAVDNDNPDRHFPVKIGGSLPAISGTVTANTAYSTSVTGTARGGTVTAMPVALVNSGVFGGNILDYNGTNTSLNVSIKRVGQNSLEAVDSTLPVSGAVTARLQDGSGNNLTSTSIGGLQRLNVSLASAATPGGSLPSFINVYGGSDGSAVRTISVDSSGRQNINAQFPRVTLIDGSGTVATANTAITVFASSSTRSYLLVQVTTGSAFVNVGATATTVNGINLTAGQGYSWETTIPQGIVSLISTTTNSRYVAKEA